MRWIIPLFILGVFSFTFASHAFAASVEPVVIGVLAPLSGKFADIGQDFKNGIELGLRDINKNKKIIEIIYEDSAAEPKIALAGFRKLVDINGIRVVIAGPGSSANLAVAPVAEEKRIIFMAHSKTPSIDSSGKYIYRMLPLLRGEAEKISQTIYQKGYRRVGLIYDSASDTQTVGKNDFIKKFKSLGGIVVAAEGYDSKSTSDFRTLLTKVRSANPDSLYLIAIDKLAGTAVRQSRELGIRVPIFGWSTWESDSFLKTAGRASEGVIFSAEPFDCNGSRAMQKYCDSYTEAFGEKQPEYYGVYAYDNLVLLASLIKKSNGNVKNIQKLLSQTKSYKGIVGTLLLDSNGNIEKNDFVIRTVKKNQFIRAR